MEQLKNSPSQSTSSRIRERGATDNELKARRLSYRELVTEKNIGYEKRSMKIGAACQTSTVARCEKGHRLSSVSIKFPSSTPRSFLEAPEILSSYRTGHVPSIFRPRTVWQRFEETHSRSSLRGEGRNWIYRNWRTCNDNSQASFRVVSLWNDNSLDPTRMHSDLAAITIRMGLRRVD